MKIKLLIPKYSAFLGKPGKSCLPLWRYTVRRYGRDSVGSAEDDEIEGWHGERYTCDALKPRHSPVNIDLTKIVQRKYLPLAFSNYDKNTQMMLSNNGYLVTIDFPDHNMRYTGGGVNDKYKMEHVHFHWGQKSAMGSEHTIDDRSYPMEMHIVHYNMKCPDIATAKDRPMGLSVLAFLFQRSVQQNAALTPIVDRLRDIKRPYTSVPLDLPSLDSIFPSSYDSYFQYMEFSPNGHPSITWTLFKEPIKISETQLAEFRKLYSTDIDMNTGKAKCLGDNNRKIVQIPDLRVFVNVPSDGEETSSEDEESQVGHSPEKRKSGFFSSLFGRKKK